MVGINEYYTSQKCPCCHNFVARVGRSFRRLYCKTCRKKFHRDTMAAHNMCNIVQERLLHQRRPLYLQPRRQDGTYPWLDPKGSSGVAPDATTSSTIPVANESKAGRGKGKSKGKSGPKQAPSTEAVATNPGTESTAHTAPPSASSVQSGSKGKRKSPSGGCEPRKSRKANRETSDSILESGTQASPASTSNSIAASSESQAQATKSSGPKQTLPTEPKAIATNDLGTESTTPPSRSSAGSTSNAKRKRGSDCEPKKSGPSSS